ncbi:hypothetical protein BCV72DRAFT_337640 [Rhizopus microsporus var. microsporus]|uniref:Uncharacterized protein n=1 Tax=Rhizopus microsporus var. microsporus TaxID=86635 RepID=A0A1X0QW20_RHIZD|nr:hypothetical protein BCV72DRAFT_337640 [Rhizopus microsporus var. microsporus]
MKDTNSYNNQSIDTQFEDSRLSADDAGTVVFDSQLTSDSSTIQLEKYNIKSQDNLFRSRIMADSGYISEKTIVKNDQYDTEEDPYRWVILFSGFLAQVISMCTLSSW